MARKKKLSTEECRKAFVEKYAVVKYKPEYCDEIVAFFDIEPYIEIKNDEGRIIDRVPARLPIMEKFAMKIGVRIITLKKWKEKYEEFGLAYEMARTCQKDILLTNGLIGAYKGNVTIFTMKNILGWRDKVEATHTGGIYIHDLVNTVSKHNQKKDFIEQRDEFQLVS